MVIELASAAVQECSEEEQVLRERLGIHTRNQAQALVNRFFPDPYAQQIYQLAETLTALFSKE